MSQKRGIAYVQCGHFTDWLIYCKDRCKIAKETQPRTRKDCCCSSRCCEEPLAPLFAVKRANQNAIDREPYYIDEIAHYLIQKARAEKDMPRIDAEINQVREQHVACHGRRAAAPRAPYAGGLVHSVMSEPIYGDINHQ